MTIPLKQFCAELAMNEGVTTQAVYLRIRRGRLKVKLIRRSRSDVLVEVAETVKG